MLSTIYRIFFVLHFHIFQLFCTQPFILVFYLLEKVERFEEPQLKARSSAVKVDLGISDPDKVERLKDQNIHLKKKQQDLQNKVKVISTQLKRMVTRLNQDGMVAGQQSADFDKQIDGLIEEQVRLKEEQMDLSKKVRVAQMKLQTQEENKQGGLARSSSASKSLMPTFQGGSFGGNPN